LFTRLAGDRIAYGDGAGATFLWSYLQVPPWSYTTPCRRDRPAVLRDAFVHARDLGVERVQSGREETARGDAS
jgi:hypothetical protein